MPNRFDYVAYDAISATKQATAKQQLTGVVEFLDANLKHGRAKSLVMTKLEEAYMWIGKAIRDEQIERNGSAPLQEERGNE